MKIKLEDYINKLEQESKKSILFTIIFNSILFELIR